jgi:hypothetical protein
MPGISSAASLAAQTGRPRSSHPTRPETSRPRASIRQAFPVCSRRSPRCSRRSTASMTG